MQIALIMLMFFHCMVNKKDKKEEEMALLAKNETTEVLVESEGKMNSAEGN